jgi:hypothetical protein
MITRDRQKVPNAKRIFAGWNATVPLHSISAPDVASGLTRRPGLTADRRRNLNRGLQLIQGESRFQKGEFWKRELAILNLKTRASDSVEIAPAPGVQPIQLRTPRFCSDKIPRARTEAMHREHSEGVHDPESDQIRDVYAYFGLAMYMAQNLERGLAMLLALEGQEKSSV